MEEPSSSRHRTRSKAAPDWTAEESLILINEITDVESEWGPTLPSFQKWQQIVENCNALDVNRNLNQCKRKWDSLLEQYNKPDGSLDIEVFKAIDRCVKGKEKKIGVDYRDEEEEEEAEVRVEAQHVIDTDPDTDPEAQGRPTKFFFETGSRKQRRRMKRQKRRPETLNPWGYSTSGKIQQKESSISRKADTVASLPENNAEGREQIMAAILQENASQINAIVEGKLADDLDYKLADLKNAEAVQTDFVRRQGDKLIDCLGKISETLNELCVLVQSNATNFR